MALLEDLIKNIADPRLRVQIAGELGKLKARKKFGLVFEDHLPEVMRLPGLSVKPGARVTKRGDKTAGFFVVTAAVNGKKVSITPERGGPEATVSKDDLIVVKRFGEPIYPALIPIDRVTRVPDKPYHTLINADNFHALQLLLFCYEGLVDVIYIDPPYNTGARDWKYNNDYVDTNDQYRHSKWLSMMKRRLELARRLLKPDGVLIVTIDEHEVHRLACLLEDLLPEARLQMVTIVNNAAGVTQGGFYRVEEYAFFAFLGGARPSELEDDFLMDESKKNSASVWFSMIRYGGINSLPAKRPKLVYPIAIDPKTCRIVATGPTVRDRMEKLKKSERHRGSLNNWLPPKAEKIKGFPVIWPFRGNGAMATWQLSPESLMKAAEAGFVRIRPQKNGPGGNAFSISYIKSGNQRKILQGLLPTIGREPNGGPFRLGDVERRVIPKTVWKRARHDAGKWGSRTIRELLGNVKFDYAKSPYAVADTLSTVVLEKPDALILDFFAGSATTLHATAMLNAADAGRRKCILVTNNEVDEAPAKLLKERGVQEGEPEFEKHGVCDAVTWPRIKACLSGKRPDGSAVPGEYLSGLAIADGFKENAQYFKLDFLDPSEVKRGDKYEAILPILWMMAGSSDELELSKGSGKYHFPKGCSFCVLLREDHFKEFAAKLAERPDITHVFLVTDSIEAFYDMGNQMSKGKRCVQLYKSYLDNFKINMEPRYAD